MKRMMTLIGLCMAIYVFGEPPTNGSGSGSREPDDLFRRTGISLYGIPVEMPEDKHYPVADNLFKLDEYDRVHGKRIETGDLPRFERAYRQWGASDGVFNVPEGISRGDEWDEQPYAVAKRNESGDWVPLSRRDIATNRVRHRPYYDNECPPYWLITLGQMVKQCDGVFIGVISEISGLTDEEKADLEQGMSRADRPANIHFRVETNLFGRIGENAVTIPMQWVEGNGCPPTNGMKLLVFYAKGFTIDITDFNTNYYFFDWEKPPETPDAPPAPIRKSLSNIRILDSPEIEKAYLDAVNGYLRLLRREKRDPGRYYEFLRPLVKSPIWRIRQDAKEDMVWLLRRFSPERFDFNRVLDDPELDWGLIKDYVRYVAIPNRDEKKSETQKQK